MDGALYVSDNRNDKLAKVEPADFLNAKKEPKVTTVFSGSGVNPNGLYPTRDGMLLMVGFLTSSKIVLDPLQLSVWAIPTALAAFTIHAVRLLFFDRRLARQAGVEAKP